MNKRKVAVGPGASSLILIAVVLALSVLTVLTMISARNDEALAQRSTETRQEVFGLFAEGERSLAKLDAVLKACLAENPDPDAYLAAVKENLPESMKMNGDRVSWVLQSETRTLECEVQVQEPGADRRTVWTKHVLTAGDIWEDDGFDDFDDDWDDEEEEEVPEDDGEFPEEEPEELSGGEEEALEEAETEGEENFE